MRRIARGFSVMPIMNVRACSLQGFTKAADGLADWPSCPPLAVEQSVDATGTIMPPIVDASGSVPGALLRSRWCWQVVGVCC